jgi:hypothetical protein
MLPANARIAVKKSLFFRFSPGRSVIGRGRPRLRLDAGAKSSDWTPPTPRPPNSYHPKGGLIAMVRVRSASQVSQGFALFANNSAIPITH